MSTGMKRWWRSAVIVSAIFATLMLGCDRATPADAPQGGSANEAVITERFAECLAAMFPQMSREELEREAQMRMADAEAVKNAEAFVEQFCGNGQTLGQVPQNVAPGTPAVTIPAGSTATQSVSVSGLGVTRAEMEEFFLARIARERTDEPSHRHELYPVAFTSVGDAEGAGKLTEVAWGGWENAYFKSGKYAVLAGKDENIYGVIFAYEADGPDQPDESEIRFLLDRVVPTKDYDLQSRQYRSQRYRWVHQYVESRSCGGSGGGGGGGGGGGLPNILPRSNKSYGPAPTLTPYVIVQNGVEMRVTCKAGIYILSIKAVGSTSATIE